MNEGDYVRTKAGLIAKYIGIDKKYEWHLFDNKIKWSYEYYTKEIDFEDWKEFIEEDVVKTSPNIIDLIKKKDIVVDYNDNIYQVVKVWKGYVFTDKKNKFGQVITLVDYQIKSIVTCEQFSQMEYKVGE